MSNDPMDFTAAGLTQTQRVVRVAFLLTIVIVCALDLFYWRP